MVEILVAILISMIFLLLFMWAIFIAKYKKKSCACGKYESCQEHHEKTTKN